MHDHQTSNEQASRAVRCVILLAAVGLLCTGLGSVPCAPGAEAGGQQVGSDNYEKMWTQTFSEEQWLQMLRQRVHQPMAVWYGMGTGMIEQTAPASLPPV